MTSIELPALAHLHTRRCVREDINFKPTCHVQMTVSQCAIVMRNSFFVTQQHFEVHEMMRESCFSIFREYWQAGKCYILFLAWQSTWWVK